MDLDPQEASDADSEEAWRTMAEARWRWEVKVAIAARANMLGGSLSWISRARLAPPLLLARSG
eukprot:890610-Alexandrium_andersonii.AAC.1